jgi:ribonuclease-3 family protein
MTDFFNSIEFLNIDNKDVGKMSPLVLAYIGDTVYEIYIRTMIVCDHNDPVNILHRESVKYVCAKAQAGIVEKITGFLTEEELYILRRGRNAKSGTIPKNANVFEYRYATGFEALVGYLYLYKNFDRLNEILKLAVSFVN